MYGGTGRVTFRNGAAKVEILNKEPHVRIVESRLAPLGRAIMRAGPDVIVGRVFAQKMGMNPRASAIA